MACLNKACSVEGCNSKAKALGLCSRHYQRVRKRGSVGGAEAERGVAHQWLINHRDYCGDDCLDWPYSTIKSGYGSIRIDGATHSASTVMCEIVHGPRPIRRMHAAHSCGRKICCSPRHLRWDTAAGNCADRIAHGTSSRGEDRPTSRLTENQVLEIRNRLGSETQKMIAEEYGVNQSTISDIKTGKLWGWLK